MLRRLIPLAAVAAAVLLPAAPASAEARVSIANPSGQARIDPTYATTLRVSGSGFQSIRGGRGGIYVFFGTVRPGWRPSTGGSTGADYLYVPDSENRDNQGFQRFVAFPGSDTANSANGGTISASGTWSTQLVVPGATFQTYDRDGDVLTVDCRKVTCGIITVGAHGVVNARNETFTPVTVGSLGDGGGGGGGTTTPAGGATASPGAHPPAAPTPPPTTAPTAGPTTAPPTGPLRSTAAPRSPATCSPSRRPACRRVRRSRPSSTTVPPEPGRSPRARTAASSASSASPRTPGPAPMSSACTAWRTRRR